MENIVKHIFLAYFSKNRKLANLKFVTKTMD